MPDLATDPSFRITRIWENTTWAAGHLGDAIKTLKDDPKADTRKDLGEALLLLNIVTAKIQEILSTARD